MRPTLVIHTVLLVKSNINKDDAIQFDPSVIYYTDCMNGVTYSTCERIMIAHSRDVEYDCGIWLQSM